MRPLVVTAGEPAGIGPDLCIDIARRDDLPEFVVVSDTRALEARAALLDADLRIVPADRDAPRQPGELKVIDVPFAAAPVCGELDPANAAALLDGLKLAVDRCLDGRFAGLVTAPLQKSVINEAGLPFTGHTEFLAEQTDAPQPVMLLVAGELRVALASTHLPLAEVPAYLTQERLRHVITVLDEGLRNRFGIERPRIAVCGLNPHAGEGGHLGTEEQHTIAPVVERLRNEGLDLAGPLSADTAFLPAAGRHDAVLAMYHDQGLPVIKYAGFGNAVNVTLGLPIVRTSVDHGTALDLAGSGKADAGSLVAAIELAARLK